MAKQRDTWQVRVNDLIEQVTVWVDPNEWATKVYPKKMRDADGTIFEVPSLVLQKGSTRLILDPIAYDVPGAEGLVDLYLMPTYDDTASFYLVDGRWQIHSMFSGQATANDVKQAEVFELSAETVNRVLDEIAAHAVPSFSMAWADQGRRERI